MAKPKVVVTAQAVEAAVKKRFERPAWALLWQVGNATGFGCNRHADAVAFSLWPSRGLELHGIEIKVSRQDWLKEIAAPAKAEEIAKFCDRWWLVVGDAAIVRDGELPATWGLLVLKGKKLFCVKEAPKLKPEPMPRSFIAALFRRADEVAFRREEAAECRGFERGKTITEQAVTDGTELKRLRQEHESLKQRLDDFEKESGIRIDQWGAGNIGKAVRMLKHAAHRVSDPVVELNDAADHLERQAKALRRDAEEIRKAVAELPGDEKVVG